MEEPRKAQSKAKSTTNWRINGFANIRIELKDFRIRKILQAQYTCLSHCCMTA